MAEYTSLKGIFDKVERAVLQGRKSAAKKAANSTRAMLAQIVKEDIGIPSAKTKKRTKVFKADESGISVSVGTKYLFPVHDFGPRRVKVMSQRGPRQGVTYQVKGQARVIAPNGFMVEGKTSKKKIVVQRKTENRYPTTNVVIDIFRNKVLNLRSKLQDYLKDMYAKNLEGEIKFRLDKLK